MGTWTPSERQAELVKNYKKDNLAASQDPANVANRVASLYQEGDVEAAKALYKQAGLDSSLDGSMQETAKATVPTRSGGTTTSDRLWNDRGELNAYDTKDALGRLERHAQQTIWSDKKSFIKANFSDDQKVQLMEKLQNELRMGNNQTLGRLTAQLQRPVRRVLDYIGFARKAAVVHEVGQGEIPYYDLDPEVFAYVVSQDGAVPANRVESTRILPVHERIMSKVEITIEEAAIRSFNAMERQKDLAIQDMQRQEDKKLTNALWVAANGTNTPVTLPSTLTLASIEEIALTVDENDLHATRLYINRAELKDIRTNIISQFDPVTQREVFNTGMLGVLYDYALYVSPSIIPKGFVFATTDPDYLAYIAIWVNTTAEVANNFDAGEPVYGFTFYELLGFTVVNDAAVAVGRKAGAALPDYLEANV